jgi:cyclic pyranopterin phosphate synthase
MTDADRKLSHVNEQGRARMVDVGDKPDTDRVAVARGTVFMHADTLALVEENRAQKGDVLTVAKLAGIQAAKRTDELIPLAHSIPLSSVDLEFHLDPDGPSIGIRATARAQHKTGVEMEALVAVSVAALTIYDMLKAADREMVIGEINLWEKRGGQVDVYRRDG